MFDNSMLKFQRKKFSCSDLLGGLLRLKLVKDFDSEIGIIDNGDGTWSYDEQPEPFEPFGQNPSSCLRERAAL